MNRLLDHRYLVSSPLLRLPAQRSSAIISATYSPSISFASLRFCHSSSNNNSPGGATQPSKRKEFASLSPDLATLDLLDRLHLGYLPKRRNRVAVAKKFGNVSKSHPNYNNNDKARQSNNNNNNRSSRGQQDSPRPVPPFPFHRLGRPVLKVDHFDNLDHKLFLSLLPSLPPHGISSLQPPVSPIPEVAIVGRSNVGKSSLLNALLRLDDSFVQKASVTPKPGETRSLQFFALGTQPERLLTWDSRAAYRQNSHSYNERRGRGTEEEEAASRPAGDKTVQKVHLPALLLVDLPGYGFAFLNEETMLRCQDLCSRYLLDSHNNSNNNSERQEQQGSHGELYSRNRALKRVLLLLDARHGFKLTDKAYFEGLLEHRQRLLEEEHGGKEAVRRNQVKINWKLQIVLTKCDLVDRLTLARRMKLVRDQVNDFLPGLGSNLQVIPVSSKDNRGILELQQQLAALVPASVRPAPDSPHARPYFHPIRRHSLTSTSTSSARKERKQLRAKREARAEKAGVGLYYADGSVGTARIKNRWVTGFGDKLCRAERRRLQFGNPDGSSPVRVRTVVDDDGNEVDDNFETSDQDSRRRRSGKNKEKRMSTNESFPSQSHPSSRSSDNSSDRKNAASRSRRRGEKVDSDRGDKSTTRSPRNSSRHQLSVTNPAIVDVDDALHDDIVAPWETSREPNTSPGGRRRPKKPTKK